MENTSKFVIVGVHNGCLHYFQPNGCMITCHGIPDFYTSPKPLFFKTRDGARARIEREIAGGEPMAMAVLECPSLASALGKLALGKSKNITPEESAARAERMAAARRKRWAK